MNSMSRLMNNTSDLDTILTFVQQHLRDFFHVVDMPYRLCSPAAQDAQNVRLWEVEDEVVGFCVVQLPFSTLDWAVRPGYEALADEVVGWVVERLQMVANERQEGFGFLFDSRMENDQLPLRHGFVLDDWHIRNLAQELVPTRAAVAVPEGFTLRPLRGQAEADDYAKLHREAFNTRNMSTDWRERTIRHAMYQPDLDLVIEDEQGRLAAFCIGWAGEVKGEHVGQIEPVGVLPEYQKRGLGRAILETNLHRMAARGIRRVLIDAESYNPASQHLYETAGFREISRAVKYFRRFEPVAD